MVLLLIGVLVRLGRGMRVFHPSQAQIRPLLLAHDPLHGIRVALDLGRGEFFVGGLCLQDLVLQDGNHACDSLGIRPNRNPRLLRHYKNFSHSVNFITGFCQSIHQCILTHVPLHGLHVALDLGCGEFLVDGLRLQDLVLQDGNHACDSLGIWPNHNSRLLRHYKNFSHSVNFITG